VECLRHGSVRQPDAMSPGDSTHVDVGCEMTLSEESAVLPATRFRYRAAAAITTNCMYRKSLARAVCQAPHSFSVSDLRCSLHWLPIRQRIDYKIATITYKVRQTNTPVYMASLISDYIPSRTLQSSDNCLNSDIFSKGFCFWLTYHLEQTFVLLWMCRNF